ncbi:MAG TPA: 50S ribosomal protein L10 [Gemmatimonadaceae bacterium]|nr:50S ribosomal protein L10 [Gemmatimonadaceae bacterium]
MKRSDKEQLVAELKSKIKGADALYYTDFTGLNVKRMTELRRRFRKAGVEYVVIKNTLALKAVNESGLAGSRLKGPTGVVIAKDAIAAAKVLTDFAKANDAMPSVKGGLYEGAAIDGALVKTLALMPTRDEALGQFLGLLNTVFAMFVGVLEARKVQLETAAAASAAPAVSAAPAAEAAPAAQTGTAPPNETAPPAEPAPQA